ncbi:MAG: hemolysin family protein [Solirubrobacterales bacterium]
MEDALRALALATLVVANAFFVIGEYTVVTVRRTAVAARAGEGSRSAAAALRLMDDPVRVISTVQVGITAIGILAGAVGEPLVREMLGDGIPAWLGFAIAFLAVTFVTVVFGELVPKALTLDRAERLALLVARPVELTTVLLRPVVWVLQVCAQAVLRPFGVRRLSTGRGVSTPEELDALVEEARSEGVIPHAQEELLHNVFSFASREAVDAMVPAPRVDWLDASLSGEAALGQAVEHPRSRYPVGSGSLDRPVGVIHVRELVVAARTEPGEPIAGRARSAPIVPETKDLGALLRELRERRQHLALVVDEWGTTTGIVTLEDILEELVGEIQNEYDLPGYAIDRVDARTMVVDGSMTIDDFNESVGTELPQEGVRTMAGLVFDALGHRPAPGEAVAVGGATLEVERMDGQRVARVRVRIDAPG